jgi:hypothetical protein
MDYIYQKVLDLRRNGLIALGALSLFCAFFFLLASHVTVDDGCDYVVDKKQNFIEYKDVGTGSDQFWTDFEALPYHIEVSMNLLRPQVSSTLFAYNATSSNTTPPINASGVNVPINWSLGFSVGAGYEFFHYDWDFLAKYSFFTTTENGSISTPLGGAILPALSLGLLNQTVTSSNSKLGFTWNNLEILLDKKFHFRENLLLFTSLGLESSWLSYSQKTTYSGGSLLGLQTATVQRTSHLWGIGPGAGLKTNWLFSDSLYLKGFTTGAFQYISQNTYYGETSAVAGYNSLIFKDSQDFVAPTLALGLGFGYAKYFASDARFIRFEILYEQRTFFRQNQLLNVAPATTPRFTHAGDDLSLQGFTFKIDFRY